MSVIELQISANIRRYLSVIKD